jgi:hypothetical protein
MEFFFITSYPVLGPTHPTIQVAPRTLNSGVKQVGREADNLVTRLKMRGTIYPLQQYFFMTRHVVKHRDNFTFLPLPDYMLYMRRGKMCPPFRSTQFPNTLLVISCLYVRNHDIHLLQIRLCFRCNL